MNLLNSIKTKALSLGFDACGIARSRPMPAETEAMRAWIGQGRHAGMDYMQNQLDLRLDPARVVEGTKSVIVCLVSYKTDRRYEPGHPPIAAYARCPDYHYSVKQKLEQLLEYLKETIPGADGRCFSDSAPVQEKNWAVEAGLGWIGKNSLLIHPELGSFCLIGTILTNIELDEYDEPFTQNLCGNCVRCVESCPTAAIGPDRLIDARRCISYHTIENRGPIPDDVLPAMGDRLFGCDACQEACPWNVRPEPRNHPIFQPVDGIYDMSADDWLNIGSGEFKRRFGQTPLARAGLKKLKMILMQKNETK